MNNLKITLEYDGTDFVGWQYQENGRSVQEEVEKALSQIVQENIRVNGAGRTDAGVHARGQVANFLTSKPVDEARLMHSSNGILPRDVVILSVERVSEEFHARYSAKGRRYRYYIKRRPTAMERKQSWSLLYNLDVAVMTECASLCVGDHDYASFCKNGAEVHHHRCMVQKAEWTVDGSMLVFEILSNRFLYGMVRALVGTMVEVGRGYRRLDDFGSIMDSKNRSAAGMAAPARGLFLEEVIY